MAASWWCPSGKRPGALVSLPCWGPSQKASGKCLMITRQAQTFINGLNTYEKTTVWQAASTLVGEGGYELRSAGFTKSPMFMRYKQFRGGIGLRYSTDPEMIIVNQEDIHQASADLNTPPINSGWGCLRYVVKRMCGGMKEQQEPMSMSWQKHGAGLK